MKNIDLGLMKNFHLTERMTMEFQAKAIDALNHPDFSTPSANISSPGTVGQITSSNALFLKGSAASRAVQFSLRIRF